MGAAAGGRAGFSNAGGLMGMDAGKKPQTGAGAVGTKAGMAFMRGEGGFMSRTIGAGAARNYVGNTALKNAEDKAKDDYFARVTNRERLERDMSNQTAVLERTKQALAAGASGVTNTTVATEAARLESMTNAYNRARKAESSANATYQRAQKSREKATKVAPDKPDTARDVRMRYRDR